MQITTNNTLPAATITSRPTPSPPPNSLEEPSSVGDLLRDGDEIGPGLSILGQPISIVHSRTVHVRPLRVLRELGRGSCTVTYLVQEISSHSSDVLGIDNPVTPSPASIGGLFALRCIKRHAQYQTAQLQEANIHHSLPIHENVVTLWTTFETPSYLLLVLDYVPGEDFFCFLEQQRDYEETSLSVDGVLQPFSYDRLRLVASVFTQMCRAVAHCHHNGVFHRDIRPENFRVTDERVYDWITHQDERRVTIKLSYFGSATRDVESGEMDIGSPPYISFECGNNLTPTYATGPADVWSLGIVLINMLYHGNPWRTTAIGKCSAFDEFLREPIAFFVDQFNGLTPAVAEFFATRVFCPLESPMPPSTDNGIVDPAIYSNNIGRRVTAKEFGVWARDLVLHLGPAASSESDDISHSISHMRHSHTPPEVNQPMPTLSQPPVDTPASILASAHQVNDAGVILDDESQEYDDLRIVKPRRRGKRGARKPRPFQPSDPPSTTSPFSTRQLSDLLNRVSVFINEVENAPIVLRTETEIRPRVEVSSSRLEPLEEGNEDVDVSGEEYSPPSSIASSPCSSPRNLPIPLPEEMAWYYSTLTGLTTEKQIPPRDARTQPLAGPNPEASPPVPESVPQATKSRARTKWLSFKLLRDGDTRFLGFSNRQEPAYKPRVAVARKPTASTPASHEEPQMIQGLMHSRPQAPRGGAVRNPNASDLASRVKRLDSTQSGSQALLEIPEEAVSSKIRGGDDCSLVSFRTTSTSSTAKGVAVAIVTPLGPQQVYKLRPSKMPRGKEDLASSLTKAGIL